MKKYITIMSIIFSMTSIALAGQEGMSSMPKIKPEKIFTVKDGEELESQRGFGDDEPMTRMMNLMMVEGSGMEGMDMNEHSEHSMAGMNQNTKVNTSEELPYEIEMKSTPSEVKVGTNIIEFNIKEKDKPSKGLKLKAQVYMTSMDMGTEEPKIKELSPGKYQVKAPFAMQGPWAVKLIFPNGKENVFNFEVKSK